MMILREMMLDTLQIMPLPARSNASSDEKANTGMPSFGDILNSKVNAAVKNDTVTKTASDGAKQIEAEAKDAPENKSEVRTFREIQGSARREAAKSQSSEKTNTAGDTAAAEKEAPAEKTGVDDETVDNIVNCLAQVLGMNPGEFKQLLKAADIAPEELSGLSDVQQLVSKLSNVLELNPEQSSTLKDVLELVKVKVQELVKPADNKPSAAAADTAGALKDPAASSNAGQDAPKVEVIRVQGNPESEFSALMVKLKLKLSQLQEKLKNGGSEVAEEISNQLKVLFAEPKTEKSTETLEAEPVEAVESPKTDNDVAVKTGDRQEAGNPKEGKSESRQEADGVKPAAAASNTAVPADSDDRTQVAVPVTVQVQKAGEAVQVEKLNDRAPVQTRDIINQVLEKAKVVLTGDKSEMIMDLKPDSLGKLSLKVVTEHGIVMARFVAENQQVKQVLETNMQLLKDSLEKQGMNVQGFSVSVRQDSREDNSGRYQPGTSGRTAVHRVASGVRSTADAVSRLETVERRNPYSLETSTVNFRA